MLQTVPASRASQPVVTQVHVCALCIGLLSAAKLFFLIILCVVVQQLIESCVADGCGDRQDFGLGGII